MKYTIAIILLLGAVLLAGYLDKPMNPVERTLTVCNKAHREINSFSENYCGRLLDENGLVFLCDRSGTDCWVESADR